MKPGDGTHVFVSYSHADSSLVAPVVQLLRVNKSFVFRDTDNIRPGKKWRNEIARALDESNLVVVFWCDHARASDEVSKEWKAAIEQGKDLLPLLLDATPLPAELGAYQGIDFRGTVGASHARIDSTAVGAEPKSAPPREPSAPAKSARWLAFGGLATVAAIAVALSMLLGGVPETAPPPGPPATAEHRPPATVAPAPSGSLELELRRPGTLLVPAAALVLVGAAVWWSLRRFRRAKPAVQPPPVPGEIERHMAKEVEAELLRRSASRPHD